MLIIKTYNHPHRHSTWFWSVPAWKGLSVYTDEETGQRDFCFGEASMTASEAFHFLADRDPFYCHGGTTWIEKRGRYVSTEDFRTRVYKRGIMLEINNVSSTGEPMQSMTEGYL